MLARATVRVGLARACRPPLPVTRDGGHPLWFRVSERHSLICVDASLEARMRLKEDDLTIALRYNLFPLLCRWCQDTASDREDNHICLFYEFIIFGKGNPSDQGSSYTRWPRSAAWSALDNIAVMDFAIWTRLQRYVEKSLTLNLTRASGEAWPRVNVDCPIRQRGCGEGERDGAPSLDTTFVFTNISNHLYVVRAAEPRGSRLPASLSCSCWRAAAVSTDVSMEGSG